MADPRPDPTPPDVPPPAAGGGAPGTAEAAARARWRWPLRIALGLAALLVLVVGGALLYLQTESGRRFARGVAVQQIQNALADDAEVRVRRLEGNFLSGARLVGLTIARDGETVVAVDTVLVEYDLKTLVARRFAASELYVFGPRVLVRQRADSTFNVAGLLKPADPDREQSAFVVEIDRVGVLRGLAEVHWYNPDRDSVLTLDGLRLDASGLYVGPDSLVAQIDDVAAVALAPARRGETAAAARVELAAAGQFSREALRLDRLSLASDAGTRIDGTALVRLPDPDAEARLALPDFEADLEAAPLALADARAFAGAELYGRPRLRINADSDGERLAFSVRGSLDAEGPQAGAPGTVVLDGELVAGADDGPRAVRLNGEVRRLDPSVLTRNEAFAAMLSGTLSADVRGQSAATLTGPFSVALDDSRAVGREIQRLRLDGDFRSGAVGYTLDAAIPGADLTSEGTVRPFDRVPSAEVKGRIRDLDLATLTGDPARVGRVRGTFAVVGQGRSLETAVGTAAVSLDDAAVQIGEGAERRMLRFSQVDVDAALRAGQVAFDADAALAEGGRLSVSGRAEPTADPLVYTVSRGVVTDLDLAALTGNPEQSSRLTGTFTLDGVGVDPQTARVRLAADLGPSRIRAGERTFDITRARADATLRDGVVDLDADADLGAAGRLTAAGTVRPFADPLAYDLSGRLDRVNLAELTGDPAQESEITGTYTLAGRGITPETLDARAGLQLGPSFVAGRNVDGADLTATLRGGALALTGRLDLPEGRFALDVTGRPFDADPAFALGSNTCFSDLDAGAFLDGSAVYTDLNGCLRGDLGGLADLESASGSGVLTLRRSTVNAAEISGGTVEFSLRDGSLAATVDVGLVGGETSLGEPLPDGRLVTALQARPFDARPSYAVRGRARDVDLVALLVNAPTDPLVVSMRFDVAGDGLDLATADLRGSIDGAGSSVSIARIDTVAAAFALRGGVLELDTLVVDANLATARGGGRIALADSTAATDFRLTARAADLDPVLELVNAAREDDDRVTVDAERIELDLRVTGAPGQMLDLAGAFEARSLVYNEVEITGVDAAISGRFAPTDPLADGTAFALDGRFDRLERGELRVESGDLELAWDGEDVRLDADVTLDEDRELAVAGRFELDPEPDAYPGAFGIRLERTRVRLGQTTWDLAQPSRIIVGDAIVVRTLLLQSSTGYEQIAVDGTLDFEGEQNFVLTAEEVDIGAVTDLAGFGSLDGLLSASLILTGPAAEPVIDGTVRLDSLRSRDRFFGSLDATVGYRSGELGVQAALVHRQGESLQIDARIPRVLSLAGGEAETKEAQGDVRIEVQSEAFPIAWAQPFLADRGVTDLGGTLAADVVVTGTRANPQLRGDAALSDGRLGLLATGLTYEPLDARLVLDGNRIELADVRIQDPKTGQTRLGVGGSITLAELSVGELDLTITPTDFVAMDTRTFDQLRLDRGSEPLRLTGTLQNPRLRGAVVLSRGDIYLTDELVPPDLEPVELTDEQIEIVEERFGRRVAARDTAINRFTDALDYDLTVEIDRNVWIRSEYGLPFDIEFSGNVEARKPAFAEGSQLYGEIELVRGTVETLGKRFDIERGTLDLSGDPLAARIDLLATLDARFQQGSTRTPVQIELLVAGRLNENPEIRLRSDQLSDSADIVSVIATGQLADQLLGAGAIQGAATGLALGSLSGIVEGLASESLGLDVVQIDSDGSDLVIRVGKYLTDLLFVSGGYVVRSAADRRAQRNESPFVATLDYELLDWLLAQGELSGERGVGGGLSYEFAW